MSKLFNNYISLKSQDSNKFYLFKSGIFYIFLDDDARAMSQQFGFKLSNLNNSVVKCGFPTNSLDKYIEKFKIAGYSVHIVCDDNIKTVSNSVDLNFFVNNQFFEKTLNNFLDLNIDMLSISQAFDTLFNLQHDFKQVMQEVSDEKEKATCMKQPMILIILLMLIMKFVEILKIKEKSNFLESINVCMFHVFITS